jgi:predicted nuclease of predicted toxin-antitoxin system
VRFLIDAQLPPALARQIESSGHEAAHVADVDLLTAPDRQIWLHATATGSVLITKDEDFITMRALNASGPAIVWIRLGNAVRRVLLGRFAEVFPMVLAALTRGDSVVEISDF